MRKCWRTWRPTHLATWRRWKPFLNCHRRRRGRGSASWSRLSSPSTDILTSPTMRGEQPSEDWVWVLGVNAEHVFLCIYCVLVSVWRWSTVSSTTLWCPSMSKMILNGGRTTMVLACPLTGQRLKYVTKFHSQMGKIQYMHSQDDQITISI